MKTSTLLLVLGGLVMAGVAAFLLLKPAPKPKPKGVITSIFDSVHGGVDSVLGYVGL